ncbi:MAG: class I SAM-dependent methyltransferase [Candidatus Aminicenantaceae bacterium]
MARDKNVLEDYEKIWKRWAKKEDRLEVIAQHRLTRSRFLTLLRHVIKELGTGACVVELGCGTAIDVGILSKNFPNCLFFATDLSKNAVKLAKEISLELGSVFYIFLSDMRNLPFTHNSMDLIFSQGVMEHFEDPTPFFREQIRALKHSGYLVVNVPQKYTGYTLYKHRQMKKGLWKLGWETEYSYFALKKIVCGLGLTEASHLGDDYWKSWGEPIFIVRDLGNKILRNFHFKPLNLFLLPAKLYNIMWQFVENHWGHLFMKNLIVVFKK